jgi:PAS domain S-box-containing protein
MGINVEHEDENSAYIPLMEFLARSLIWILVGLSLGFASLDSIQLQLKGNHQFEFAGYYAAVAQGYYAQEGLAVAILPNVKQTPPVDDVIFGRAEYGVEGANLIRAWSEGKPVVSLAVIFQRSPQVLIAQSDFTIPQQLANQPVALGSESNREMELQSMLQVAGLPDSLIMNVESVDPIEDFIQGKIIAFYGNMGNEPEVLLRKNIQFNVLRPGRYESEFYGDCLFTSKLELEQNPERVVAFTRASLKGWAYALEHPEELVELIHRNYAPNLDLQHLRFEAKVIKEISAESRNTLGEQDSLIWQQDADFLFKAGLLPRQVSVDRYVYSIDRIEQERRASTFRFVSVLASIALFLLLLFSLLTWFLWRGVHRRNVDLIQSQVRLEQALRATSDAVWDWPNLSGPLWISPLGLEMIGLNPSSNLVGWGGLLERILPEDRSSLQSELDFAIKTLGTLVKEVRVDFQGEPHWIRIRGVVSENGITRRLTGIFQDIHQLKTAEMALRESEARFRQYFELGLVGMATVNVDGEFLQVNRVLWEMLETTESDILRQDWKQYTHPGDQVLEEDLMESVTKGERQGYTIDKRFISAKRNTIFALVATRAVLDLHGKVAHWVMLVLDISQRRQGEQEKERILHQLSLKNRTLEGMLHTISHDFRHPLVNVMWYSQEIEQSIQDLRRELNQSQIVSPTLHTLVQVEFPQYISEIRNGAQVIDRMLGGMLALSRLGRQAPDFVPVEMNQVVQVLLEEKRQQMEEIQALVQVGTLPPCLGSESQLYQVWKNLLENAMAYRDPERNLMVNIEGKIVREWVVYTMEDNGIGIPTSNLGHIFAPFFRINPKGSHAGDGLGLTFVTRILESHRGHIKVESEVGKGARFSVYLPKVSSENL